MIIKPQIFQDAPCPHFAKLYKKTSCFETLFAQALQTTKLTTLKFVDIFDEKQKINLQNITKISFTISTICEDEIAKLNATYRQKNKPTNVLSFEGKFCKKNKLNLGDIYICPSVIELEAKQQCKNIQHHYIHMLLHGFLHLLGLDHETEKDATKMEAIEIKTLAKFCIENPYL